MDRPRPERRDLKADRKTGESSTKTTRTVFTGPRAGYIVLSVLLPLSPANLPFCFNRVNTLLYSNAVQQSFNKYGSYLLSQAFSEGCPTHPSYPTGHGTVGGACVTVLKFFFNGSWTIPNPVMPSDDGLSLQPYSGPSLTVNGELAKIAHNVSFGHGIHAGIHYRSDTDQSLLFGEAVALRVLQDRASCYNEKFSVSITKFDGTTATISN